MKVNTNFEPFRKNIVTAAICAALFTITTNAQAIVLNAETDVILNTFSASDSDTNAVTGAASVSANSTDSDSTGNGVSNAKGNDSGWMYVNSGGNGLFRSESVIHQTVEFTNTTSSAQNYSYDYTINFGSLSAYGYMPAGSESVGAGNKVSITLNGAEIFMSNAQLVVDSSGASLTTSGAVLGSYSTGNGFYSWSEQGNSLALGIFDAGETFTLDYDITTFAFGSYSDPNCNMGDYGYGDGIGDEIGDYYCGNEIYSQFGDPNGLSSVPINGNTVTNTPVNVPAPATLFLLGAGITGLAFSRRRKQRNG